jgi:predicted Fe-Mo cluster-binding NifX family protein
MKIVVTAEGNDLEAPSSPRFGRCPTFVLLDVDTMVFEALPNPALSASGGAGVQAAQFVVEQDVRAVLTGNVGPNATEVLRAAGVDVYLNNEATVQDAVEAFKAGRLEIARGPSVRAHAGMGGLSSNPTQPTVPVRRRDEEITALRNMAADLRKQLAEIINRIEQLEKER